MPSARTVACRRPPGAQRPTEVRDTSNGRLVARVITDDFARSVAFSPDGARLAIGRYGGAQLWSPRIWKPIGRRLDGPRVACHRAADLPDGTMLASGSADGTLRLWDLRTQKPIGSALTIEPNTWVAAPFAPDGSHRFAVPHRGCGLRWDISPEHWKRHACRVAGRDLTPRQRQDALPGRRYRTVCQTH